MRQFLLARRQGIETLVVCVAVFGRSEIGTRFESVEGSFHVLRPFLACHLSNSLLHEDLKQNHSPLRLRFFSCSARTFRSLSVSCRRSRFICSRMAVICCSCELSFMTRSPSP